MPPKASFLRSTAAKVGTPAGAVFVNCVAICVPGGIAEPDVAMLIDPLTGPPVGSATGTGAGVCPAGTGVAGGSVATACTEYGVCDGIGTGVAVGVAVGDAVALVTGLGVTPPPPPHPTAAMPNADAQAIRNSACLKASSLQVNTARLTKRRNG